MRRTITITDIEPAPLSIRHPLGINFDLLLAMKDQRGVPVDPTNTQFVLLPRSRGGIMPFDMDAYDVTNGLARVQVPGTALTDQHGYSIEVYSRTVATNPEDPPWPTGLLAKGTMAMEGSSYMLEGPLSLINIPVVVGPAGPIGETGATGPTGQRGSVWRTDVGPPSTLPQDLPGDMYLNENNGDVYRFDGGTSLWVKGTF